MVPEALFWNPNLFDDMHKVENVLNCITHEELFYECNLPKNS